ncbi:3-galactosyl-N-acetylglucosaminide 4-alpha-L-fucosyltransferase FUT3 [Lepeophtheirus salmonis]|uniref:3-galactosyl-N-acetylglucosaminide 4-alpha-L-fucosyltransferase FUT3 n=1 Tax=Lepeophtheirus salmonis TaxID=72036 RepID=UPI001AE459A8|nr:3-galactosyl-N-acetylglucosaminide 4-alpha-L-fucosyltransferase FUT3-like [Lepeophtheirus salmonis]XP_040570003.1 3-galactosyl-N-acetylglucosaminide 4-alpha-L-fucosyltransferase FUT3-like [Lepeophtheirus salmonis]XP_040570011.1 3-galactosyl-N-acetylglucosaminide 4-alpha-L-fucosyltransferase FUT3-like [Lepeophtheirus salmonis]
MKIVRRKLRSVILLCTNNVGWLVLAKIYIMLVIIYSIYLIDPFVIRKEIGKTFVNKTSEKTPLILVWTHLQKQYIDWFYNVPIDEKEYRDLLSLKQEISPLNCPSSCSITLNRNLIESSDAVLISLYDMNICLYLNKFMADVVDILTFGTLHSFLCWFPSSNFGANKDVFLFFHEPPNILFSHMNKNWALQYLENRVDYTISYRRDSTIFTPYISSQLKFKSHHNSSNPSIKSLSAKSKVHVKIAWMVSNCNTASKREEYVAILSKYVEVLVIGKCGEDICSLLEYSVNDCMDHLISEGFNFYLSFENEICSDYLTEKFDKTLSHDIVPIVMSGSLNSIQDILPPKSGYIDVSDFESPEDLSNYLLSMTKEQWISFMEWKRNGAKLRDSDIGNKRMFGSHSNYVCKLCHFVSQETELKAAYSIRDSFITWWNAQICLYSWRNLM